MYKIYLLDDEVFILEGLKYILPWEEYEFEIVGSATNGQDGFEEIINQQIDLVITDIMMPKMTGLELMSRLQECNYDTNFIVLSAFEEFSYAKKAMNMGADNYLLKPIDIEELSKSLQSVLKKLKKKEMQSIDNRILQNNLLLKLVSEIPTDTTINHLMSLGVSLEEDKYYTAIVEIKNKEYDMNNLINNILNSDIIYCIESKSTAVLIIKESDISNMLEMIKAIKDELSILTNDVVYASIGKCVESPKDLYESFETAKDVHEYKLVYSELSWIKCYEECSFSDETPYIDYEKLKKILMNKNYSETLEYVKDIFIKLRTEDGLKPKQIKIKAIEIFLVVYNYFNESKVMKGLNIYLENLINIDTVGEIELELSKMIKYMQSKLEQTEESISPVILKLLQHIEEKYKEDLNLKEISDKLNINSIYLGQLFQKETGILFSDYINNFRINKAKQLLSETTLKASDIGDLVGYTNKNYFYRKFKDIVGITPSEWRKINI